MSEQIRFLSESPCFQCGKQTQCLEKLSHNQSFLDIRDNVIGKKGFDYKKCGLWIALELEEKYESNKSI